MIILSHMLLRSEGKRNQGFKINLKKNVWEKEVKLIWSRRILIFWGNQRLVFIHSFMPATPLMDVVSPNYVFFLISQKLSRVSCITKVGGRTGHILVWILWVWHLLKTTYWKRFLTQDFFFFFFFPSQSRSKLFTTQGWKGQAPLVFLLRLPLPHPFPPLLGSRQFLRWKLYCYSNCHWLWELSVPWDSLLELQLSIIFAATLV